MVHYPPSDSQEQTGHSDDTATQESARRQTSRVGIPALGRLALKNTRYSKKGASHFKLEEALHREGCALCCLVEEVGCSYLKNVIYESANNLDVHKKYRSSLGLCEHHARQSLEMNEGSGVAILCRATTQEILHILSKIPASPQPRKPLAVLLRSTTKAKRSILEPGDGCTVCQVEEKEEDRYLRALLEGAGDGSLHGHLNGPGTICIKHLSRISALADGWLPPELLEIAREEIRDLNVDLGLYVRHIDFRYRNEPWGSERDAPERAVDRIVGRRRT